MYPVTTLKSDLSFDKLLIEKLGCDQSVAVNDRIFALAQAGICEDSFYARIQSFECNPKDVSLTLILEHDGNRVVATVNERGEASLEANQKKHPEALTSYLIAGEDLQGEYWGGVFVLPLAWLEGKLGCSLAKGAKLLGNFIREGKTKSSAYPEVGKFIIE